MMKFEEHLKQVAQMDQMKLGMALNYSDSFMVGAKGSYILHMVDALSGEVLLHMEKDNLIVLDASVIAARLFANSLAPSANKNNGLTMLAVGTGATGALLAPDAPQVGQRRLNTEICRKPFSSFTFRDAQGTAVSRPTHIVDWTATFGEADAVGPWNEMALISARSSDPTVKAPIMNGPSGYDPTIDVTNLDQLANYSTFACIAKPAGAILTVSWRITF